MARKRRRKPPRPVRDGMVYDTVTVRRLGRETIVEAAYRVGLWADGPDSNPMGLRSVDCPPDEAGMTDAQRALTPIKPPGVRGPSTTIVSTFYGAASAPRALHEPTALVKRSGVKAW
jgi:hypothetical protein